MSERALARTTDDSCPLMAYLWSSANVGVEEARSIAAFVTAAKVESGKALAIFDIAIPVRRMVEGGASLSRTRPRSTSLSTNSACWATGFTAPVVAARRASIAILIVDHRQKSNHTEHPPPLLIKYV